MGHLIFWSCLVALSLLGAWHVTSAATVAKIRRLDQTQRIEYLNSLRSPFRGAFPAAMALLSSIWTVQLTVHGEARALAYGTLTAVSVVTVVVTRRGAHRVARLFERPTPEDEWAWERMRTTRRWLALLGALALSSMVLQSFLGDIDEMPLAGQALMGVLGAGFFVAAAGSLFSWSSAMAATPIRPGHDVES